MHLHATHTLCSHTQMPMTHTCRYYTYRPHTLGTCRNSTHALWPHHWRCGSANFSSKSLGRCPLRTTCNHTTTGLTELMVKSPCCPSDVLPRGSSPDPERNQHCKTALVLIIRLGSTHTPISSWTHSSPKEAGEEEREGDLVLTQPWHLLFPELSLPPTGPLGLPETLLDLAWVEGGDESLYFHTSANVWVGQHPETQA